MIHVKSVRAGLAAPIITAAVINGVVFTAPFMMERPTIPPSGGGWYFVGSSVPLWLIVAVLLLVFAVIYVLTFRKLRSGSMRDKQA